MKKNFLLLLCLFVSVSTFSQKDSVVNYLDRSYKKVKKEQATYIQTIVEKDSYWLGTVYFGSGKMKLQGNFKKKNLKTRIGVFKRFNEKGKLKSIQTYNSKGKKEGIYSYFNDNGQNITNGYFLNGKKEGVWKYLDEQENIRARIVFKKDKVLKYSLWDEKGTVLDEELILWSKPKYKKGAEAFKSKLKQELMTDLKKEGFTTNFLVKCSINESGKFEDISISPKLDVAFEEKIINFFTKFEGMKPAILANRKVKYSIEFPIIFNNIKKH
jgi:antitoxin component YwqK of YwqJK toxin-antitoxin module